MARKPIPTWFFAVAVVRRGDRFLVVQEADGLDWYLPAGRAEPGEPLAAAARRETLEEAGIPIRLKGVIRVEHSPTPEGARVRAVFLAEPQDETPPKDAADGESLGAAWVTPSEMAALPLRGQEALDFCIHVASGRPVFPLWALAEEGDPIPGGRPPSP